MDNKKKTTTEANTKAKSTRTEFADDMTNCNDPKSHKNSK